MHWQTKYTNKCKECHTASDMHMTWPQYSTRVPKNTYPVRTEHTVEPLINGHFGDKVFVRYKEVSVTGNV